MTQAAIQKRNARAALLGIGVLLVALVGSMILWQPGARAQVPFDQYASQSPTVLPTIITNTGSPSPTPVPSDTVLGIFTEKPTPPEESPPPQVLGERPPTNVLPFTGSDLTLFVAAGLASIGAGAVIVRRSRSKREHADS